MRITENTEKFLDANPKFYCDSISLYTIVVR